MPKTEAMGELSEFLMIHFPTVDAVQKFRAAFLHNSPVVEERMQFALKNCEPFNEEEIRTEVVRLLRQHYRTGGDPTRHPS